jgi:SPIRAL1-like protein
LVTVCGFADSGVFGFVLPSLKSVKTKKNKMVRGGSSGGGQSSLGYLFGSTETPQPKPPARAPAQPPQPTVAEQRPAGLARTPPEEKPALAPAKTVEDSGSLVDMGGQNKMGRSSNNYHRADGQNTGNFITDRPTTKVHAAPGGGSSLGYLFGGN